MDYARSDTLRRYKRITKNESYCTAPPIEAENHAPDSCQILRENWFSKLLKLIRTWGWRRQILAELRDMTEKDIDVFLSDVGLTRASLHAIATSRLSDSELLPRMLQRIGLNEQGKINGSILRDMQRTCLHCIRKKECTKWLDQGRDNSRHPLFCPNSFTFEGLKNPQFPL